MAWPIAAIGGGIVCAIAGWAVISALVLVPQMVQTGADTAAALNFSTRAWLLCHGGVMDPDGLRITLVPLSITAVIALVLHGVAGYAGKQAVLSSKGVLNPAATVMKVTAVLTATYAIVVTIACFVMDSSDLRAGLGALALSLVMGFFGARKSVKWDVMASWPRWAAAIPRAMGTGVLIACLGGVTALVAGILTHRTQIISMTDQLNPGWVGGIILALIQLFYVVNLILWCTSWTFGPGFTVGDSSVVSLMGSNMGLLPAFPITAALPTGTGGGSLIWLIFPIAAGAGAAGIILRARPRARFDETAIAGGLSGVLAGLAVTGLAAVTGGSLGTDRLAGLGVFVFPLVIIAPSMMGIGGMLTGFIVGLIRKPAVCGISAESEGGTAHEGTEEESSAKPAKFGWLTPVLKRAQSAPEDFEATEQLSPSDQTGETEQTEEIAEGELTAQINATTQTDTTAQAEPTKPIDAAQPHRVTNPDQKTQPVTITDVNQPTEPLNRSGEPQSPDQPAIDFHPAE